MRHWSLLLIALILYGAVLFVGSMGVDEAKAKRDQVTYKVLELIN